jgi:hypothetical protein
MVGLKQAGSVLLASLFVLALAMQTGAADG